MAKLLGDFFGRRKPGFSGRLMIDTVRGVTRVRAWPKKRGKVKSALQQQWVDWFKAANFAAKYASAHDIRRSIDLARGTPRYPRDILLMAMRGRLFWWVDEDGQRWYPAAAMTDISDTLDVLADKIGNVLVRAADRWRAPADGVEGDRLTYHPGLPPTWEAVSPTPAAFAGGALAYGVGVQSVPHATEVMISQSLEVYDTDGFYDFAANPTRLTIPAGFAWVRLTALLGFVANSTGYRLARIYKNGANQIGSGEAKEAASTGTMMLQLSTAVLPCVEGDYFELLAYQTSGASLALINDNVHNFFALQAFR